MSSIDQLISDLEEATHDLLKKYNGLKKEKCALEDKIAILETNLVSSKKDIQILQNKNKEMKVVSALAGNSEHRRLMKHKLNTLIREVDLCIADVKNKSI